VRWWSRTGSAGSSSIRGIRCTRYEVRRGDLWYQLETALREVCVTIPEATVPEFERKVNELMLVSLALTGRPKHRKRDGAARQAKGPWAR
jgi:hypothetical protein